MKSYCKRNTTATAQRKIKSLAKANGLEEKFIKVLANFTWDYDPEFGNEPIGWVKNEEIDQNAKRDLDYLADKLNIPYEINIQKNEAQNDLINKVREINESELYEKFLYSAKIKSYVNISEFASYSVLRGLNSENVKGLNWKKEINIVQIARNLFLKAFRGGSIDRFDLDYLWCDLCLELRNKVPTKDKLDIDSFLSAISSLGEQTNLIDLIKVSKEYVSGDKYLKQEYLQALSYSGLLEVNEISRNNVFIPEFKDELSEHYYSNEWTYPLRFWTTNGGKVNQKK